MSCYICPYEQHFVSNESPHFGYRYGTNQLVVAAVKYALQGFRIYIAWFGRMLTHAIGHLYRVRISAVNNFLCVLPHLNGSSIHAKDFSIIYHNKYRSAALVQDRSHDGYY